MRLKVSAKSLSKSVPKNISIPYGAIKSSDIFLYIESDNVFQFLMVRLKAKPHIPDVQWILGFQFLMVRLKGLLNPRHNRFTFISIPYGAIKRTPTGHK